MKKILALFLAASVFMTNGSIAFAAESDIEINYQETVSYGASGEELTEGDFTYIVEENGQATIISYNGTSEVADIPETVGDGILVTALDDELFYEKTGVKKVIIPKYISSIGEYTDDTFYGASDLENIEVAGGNRTYYDQNGVLFRIGASSGLPMLMKYPEARQGESYTIPKDTNRINVCAFNECNFLKKIIIPPSVSVVDLYGFINLSNKVIILQQDDPQK